MAEPRPRSFSVLVLVILLMTATSVTLVHWHQEWTGKGCELCNVRQQPILTSPVANGPSVPVESEAVWHAETRNYDPETLTLTRSSRAPPAVHHFD